MHELVNCLLEALVFLGALKDLWDLAHPAEYNPLIYYNYNYRFKLYIHIYSCHIVIS